MYAIKIINVLYVYMYIIIWNIFLKDKSTESVNGKFKFLYSTKKDFLLIPLVLNQNFKFIYCGYSVALGKLLSGPTGHTLWAECFTKVVGYSKLTEDAQTGGQAQCKS